MNNWFDKFSTRTSNMIGSSYAFVIACLITILWLLSGPLFHFNTQWSLFINTITTISTGLIVFVIQHSQNKDTQAIHLKLDELVRSVDKANNDLVEIEKK